MIAGLQTINIQIIYSNLQKKALAFKVSFYNIFALDKVYKHQYKTSIEYLY